MLLEMTITENEIGLCIVDIYEASVAMKVSHFGIFWNSPDLCVI